MKYKIINPCRVLPVFILLFFVFLQGCVANLPAVRDFSQTTVVAAGSFDDIADDLPKSCIRRVELTFEGKKVTIVDSQVEYSAKYKESLATCDDIKNSLDGIIGANNVLKGYAEALGKLASDDAVTFTQEINALDASLKQININGKNPFDGPRATAVSGLAKFLFNAAVNGYRQKELKETIQMGHEHLEQIIGGLSDVAGDYQVALKTERLKIERVQVSLIDEREKPEELRKSRDEDINNKLLETVQMIESINVKNKAAEDYKMILAKIAETHEKLYQSTNELDSGVLIVLIQDYAKELIPLINNIREAFSS